MDRPKALVHSIAVFPGSFDPPHWGHLNIIERAAPLFDELIVLVAYNDAKNAIFSPPERCSLLEQLCKKWTNVQICSDSGLTADFCKKVGARVIVRGLRPENFNAEFSMAIYNRALSSGLETLFMPADARFLAHSSTGVKTVAANKGNLDPFVPPLVAQAIKRAVAEASPSLTQP